MTRFRPCIDLHEGQVKQIVGGTLRDGAEGPQENFVSEHSPKHFASMYAADNLSGGHVIQLGSENEAAAREALSVWPGGFQIGGGVNAENAAQWIEAGASHVIVTSWLFDVAGHFLEDRLAKLVSEVGKERLVIDLSCRVTENGWQVAMNRWQTLTELAVTVQTLDLLADHTSEFLIHAADVEGLCQGIDEGLVQLLGDWGKIPITYAGGVRSMDDVKRVAELSNGNVDITVGSALDIFGGTGVAYTDLVAWNQEIQARRASE